MRRCRRKRSPVERKTGHDCGARVTIVNVISSEVEEMFIGSVARGVAKNSRTPVIATPLAKAGRSDGRINLAISMSHTILFKKKQHKTLDKLSHEGKVQFIHGI